LHLANSSRANDVVKQLHWNVKNHFLHYGGSGLLMLGYDPARPADDTAQEAFAFDRSAHDQTVEALIAELPGRIQKEFPHGVSFNGLYEAVCNETPASKDMLRLPIDQLCRDLALKKQGIGGEERAFGTKIKDDDLIIMHPNRAFSFLRK